MHTSWPARSNLSGLKMLDRQRISQALSEVASATVGQILAIATAEPPRIARVIGVTGSPGAGKSTLIGRLAAQRLAAMRHLAIIAIDPTSPKSDGSLLGDRVRLGAVGEDPRVYIRSLPSRSAEDGLTDNIAEIIATLDRFGFDEIILETVGAGQTAYGVRAVADVEVLVLTPGAGDYIQAMKAGIMETADIYVVNKADMPGAGNVAAELLGVLSRGSDGESRTVLQASASSNAGIAELSAELDRRLARSPPPGERVEASLVRRRYRVRQLLQRRMNEILQALPAETLQGPLAGCYQVVASRLADERASSD
jgi:LAO/AO transport system kinase